MGWDGMGWDGMGGMGEMGMGWFWVTWSGVESHTWENGFLDDASTRNPIPPVCARESSSGEMVRGEDAVLVTDGKDGRGMGGGVQ